MRLLNEIKKMVLLRCFTFRYYSNKYFFKMAFLLGFYFLLMFEMKQGDEGVYFFLPSSSRRKQFAESEGYFLLFVGVVLYLMIGIADGFHDVHISFGDNERGWPLLGQDAFFGGHGSLQGRN